MVQNKQTNIQKTAPTTGNQYSTFSLDFFSYFAFTVVSISEIMLTEQKKIKTAASHDPIFLKYLSLANTC